MSVSSVGIGVPCQDHPLAIDPEEEVCVTPRPQYQPEEPSSPSPPLSVNTASPPPPMTMDYGTVTQRQAPPKRSVRPLTKEEKDRRMRALCCWLYYCDSFGICTCVRKDVERGYSDGLWNNRKWVAATVAGSVCCLTTYISCWLAEVITGSGLLNLSLPIGSCLAASTACGACCCSTHYCASKTCFDSKC